MQREFFETIKSLGDSPNLIITKPDKKSCVVILNCCDYIEKINKILSDDFKFIYLGTTNENDNTAKIETKLQRKLLALTKQDELPRSVDEVKCFTGAQRPRMNGLPKIHKKNTPLYLILSINSSAQHKLAK